MNVISKWLTLSALMIFTAPLQIEAASSIKAMTYNIKQITKPQFFERVAQHFLEAPDEMPDFIFLQEVKFWKTKAKIQTSAAHLLADKIGFHLVEAKSKRGNLGVAILSRYPLRYSGERHLKDSSFFLLPSPWRVSLMGEVDLLQIGVLRLVTTHLAYAPWDAETRKAQLAETIHWAAEREQKRPAEITLLGGDFNAAADSKELALIHDASATAPYRFMDFNTQQASFQTGTRIDFIFLSQSSGQIQFGGEEILWSSGIPENGECHSGSDHYPVLHTYEFKNAASPER